MNVKQLTIAAGVGLSSLAFAQPANLPNVNNTMRVQWDDNVFTTGKGSSADKQESFKFINELEILFDHDVNATYFGLRYAPSFVWYEDRPGDSTDLNHQVDFSMRHRFTPLTSAQIRNTFRYAQEPELVADDVTVRRRNDFLYNSLNASVETQVVPEKTTLRLDGRYAVMRYDESAVSDDADYDQVSVGVDLVQRLAPNTEGGVQVRYTVLDYENDFRDVDAVQLGVSLSSVFSPVLHGDVRAGLEYRDADNAVEQTSTTPYIDGSLVYLPGPTTRLSVGSGFSKDKSPTNRFAQQDRFRIFGSIAQDLTPALKLFVTSSYSLGRYDRDDATAFFNPETDRDGDEVILQFSARLAYRIDIRHSLEAAYQYTELDSDVRSSDDFERNRVTIGWKYSFM